MKDRLVILPRLQHLGDRLEQELAQEKAHQEKVNDLRDDLIHVDIEYAECIHVCSPFSSIRL